MSCELPFIDGDNSMENFQGRSPLHKAAVDGHIEDVINLLNNHEYKEYMNRFDIFGCNPLHLACMNGHLDIVKCLIEHGADINAKTLDKQRTGLYLASYFNKLDTMKYLIKNGADIDSEDIFYDTPLYRVSKFGFMPGVKYLVENGANIDGNINGDSPLIGAIEYQQNDVVRYLIGKDANWNYYQIRNKPIFTKILQEVTNELRGYMVSIYLIISRVIELDIGNNVKYRLPKQLILRIVYESVYRSVNTNNNIKLYALANILRIKYYWEDPSVRIEKFLSHLIK